VAEAVLRDAEERERLFRRALAISAGAHVLLLLMALVSPFPRSRSVALPGVMSVNLVAAAPSASAARPAARATPPAAKPKPKPVEPPKPVVPPPPKPEVKADKKLLPKEAVQPPKPAPPKPKPAVAPPEPKPKEEPLDYADALDALRDELGEEAGDAPDPEVVASVRPTARPGPPGGGGGGGDPLDPEVAAWMRRVKIHVSKAWVLPPGFKRQVIQAQIEVTLDATGNVLEVDVSQGSGNPFYDESVVRAIEKASPLPPPPESGDWPFLFSPQDQI
jgi:TonB family protein